MKTPRAGSLWIALILAVTSILSAAAQQGQRVPAHSVRLPSNPPNVQFSVLPALAGLTFSAPVAIVTPPGETNRLFIVEQAGQIVVITNLAAPTKTTFLDIRSRTQSGGERGLLGLAFHPNFAQTGHFYVFYTRNTSTTAGTGLHDRLARFSISATDSNRADPNSEVDFFSQYDQASNHNGGDLHFGPDGYLYVSLGDEGGGDDQYSNSQRIDKDFFAGVLRIDVDQLPGNLAPNPHPAIPSPAPYSVPADNPFVGATNFITRPVDPTKVRTEFWATGLRNPWRMSFDGPTLYLGDVGQGALEEIDIIVKGGNYGWAYREGTRIGPKSGAPAGFTYVPPINQYGRTNGFSVTGGVVARSRAIPELRGKYIFGDFGSGRIWALTPNGTNSVPATQIASDAGVAAFGIHPGTGEVLLADVAEGRIKRIAYSSAAGTAPATLEATGLFTNLAQLEPAVGVMPFEVNLPYWTDGAVKQRWFSIPDTNDYISASDSNRWEFPAGSIWVQHFDFPITNGLEVSNRRLETRVLVKTTNSAYGLTYHWNEAGTAAALAPAGGTNLTFNVTENGQSRELTWKVPARSDCMRCHSEAPGWAIGFQPWQLNRELAAGEHQIEHLQTAGYFATAATNVHLTRIPVAPTNNAWSEEYRVRSWLAANCAHCHQPGGNGPGFFDTRLEVPTDSAGLINGPLRAPEGDERVITPGSLELSELYQRLITSGPGHMPPLDSQIPDPHALPVIAHWITNGLPNRPTFGSWATNNFANANGPEAGRDSDPDGDFASNYLEYLTETVPTNSLSRWSLTIEALTNNTVAITFPQTSNRLFQVETTATLTNAAWAPLDTAANRPFVSATNGVNVLIDPATNRTQFYRVSVSEP